MYNKRYVIPGLAIFVLFVTMPLWYNMLSAGSIPKPELPPNGAKECVASAAEMRASHMQLLLTWRDEVLREGDRTPVQVGGKEYPRSLQLACMNCHSNKEKFCDECHNYTAVTPYCWDCHLTPAVEASKKETL
ncbi:MAG: sulfate reduction electron transfer complex DsrMKJOP subunit DsrJ [Desulfopila sp.]